MKNRGVRADAERQRENGHERESGIRAQHACGISNVANGVVNQRQTASVATGIFLLVQSANRDHGPAACLLKRHAAGDLRLDMLFEVEAEFSVEFGIDLLGSEE